VILQIKQGAQVTSVNGLQARYGAYSPPSNVQALTM